MGQDWIEKNIRDMETYNPALAQELRDAYKQKRIRGMVVKTKIDADGTVLDPEWEIKDWNEIGPNSW